MEFTTTGLFDPPLFPAADKKKKIIKHYIWNIMTSIFLHVVEGIKECDQHPRNNTVPATCCGVAWSSLKPPREMRLAFCAAEVAMFTTVAVFDIFPPETPLT